MTRIFAVLPLFFMFACQCGPLPVVDAGDDAGDPSDGGIDGGSDGGVDAGSGGDDAGTVDSGVAEDEFDAWREMQMTVRLSADHLPARARALVDVGDAEAIFTFVRDEIALIPGRSGFYASSSERRFGVRGTLRGGMGTMRERAELLQSLLVDAGFEATLHQGESEPGYDVGVAMAFAPTRAFTWPVDDEMRARWRALLTPEDLAVTGVDVDGVIQSAIADSILDLALAPSVTEPFDLETGAVPFVQVIVDGQPIDANPNVPDAVFGDARVFNIIAADEPGGLEDIHVRVSAARDDAPNAPFTLVEKTWNAADVVGRTITAAFVPPLGLLQAATTRAIDVETFVPVLAIRGADLTPSDGAALSAVGGAFSRGGDVIDIDVVDGVSIDGALLPAPPSSPVTLAAVATATVVVDAKHFPRLVVEAVLKDADGGLLPGLAADAFSLDENGASARAEVRRTLAPAPAVLLLFDRSASLPPAFLDDAPFVGHAIAEALFAAVPDVTIQVAGIDFTAPLIAGPFTSSIDDVDAQLTVLNGQASELWSNLASLSESAATMVVCISDFVADDIPTLEYLSGVARGAPVLAVAVGTANLDVAAEVAVASGGASLVGVAADDVALGASLFAAERAVRDYKFVMTSRVTGTGEQTITLSVDGGRVTGVATYTAPPEPLPPPALSGLFVDVTTNGRTVRRTIAGTREGPVTPVHVDEVTGALFGRVLVGVEAGPPSFAVKIDETLDERLRFEPAVDAKRAGDLAALAVALETSLSRIPSTLRFAFSVSRAELSGASTYPDGLDVAIAIERPVFESGLVRTLDYLPLVAHETAFLNDELNYVETVRRTVFRAAIEATLFPTATAALLDGEVLAVVDPLTVDFDLGVGWYGPVEPYAADYVVIAPVDGDPIAFFAVHKRTGDVIGVLADGTGGAIAQEIDQTLAQIDVILDIASRGGDLIGFQGINVWIELERTKAKLIGAATVVIGEGGDVDFEGILADAIIGAAEDGITGEIPGWDEAFAPVDDLSSISDAVEVLSGREMPDVTLPGL